MAAESTGAADGARMLIESCQRREVYGSAPCGCPAPEHLLGYDALRHLAEVAAGLDSVVLGEAEIMGQVRSAVAKAPPALRPAGDLALAAARELRRETTFSTHTGHLLDRAVEIAGMRPSGRLLIVGTGHVARQVASRARTLGFSEVVVCGRREPTTNWYVAGRYAFVPLDQLASAPDAEVLVGCLGPDAPRIDLASGLPAAALVADLGMPPNFTGAGEMPYYTIADLFAAPGERHHSDELRARLRERLGEILARRVEMARVDGASPVGQMRKSVERLRQEELSRFQRLHPDIPAPVLDRITRSLVNKILHAPSQRMKEAGDGDLGRALASAFEPDAARHGGT